MYWHSTATKGLNTAKAAVDEYAHFYNFRLTNTGFGDVHKIAISSHINICKCQITQF